MAALALGGLLLALAGAGVPRLRARWEGEAELLRCRAELTRLAQAVKTAFAREFTRPSVAQAFAELAADDPLRQGRDPWGRDYHIEITADRAHLGSAGPDGSRASEDDMTLRVDFASLRRQETLRRLSVIQRGIVRYNHDRQLEAPLPADWTRARALLVEGGYLSPSSSTAQDAWGDPFEPWPPDNEPLLRVRSAHVDTRGT